MSTLGRRALACDLWICDSLGGAEADDTVWLARLRGLALGGAGLTLAMSAWKAIGPLTASDLFLAAAVVLLLPRVELANVRRMWVPALAVALITVGGVIGTAVTGADVTGSAEVLARFAAASFGAVLLVVCWRPGLKQITSFSWLWIAGGVISAMVALLIPHLHMFLRPSGLTPHPSHLAIVSLILLGVALGLIASDPRRNQSLVGLAASGVLFAAVVASGSRAGLVAALLVVLLALIATRNRVTIAATVSLIVVGLVLVLTGAAGEDNALDRLGGGNSTTSASDESRDASNAAGWERFESHPVTGVGFADATEPHNFFLQMGSSAGVLGIVGGLMLVVLALRSYALAVWKRMPEHPAHWAMVAGLAAAVIGYLAASLFQNIFWDRNVWIAIALMTWAAAAALDPDPGPPGSGSLPGGWVKHKPLRGPGWLRRCSQLSQALTTCVGGSPVCQLGGGQIVNRGMHSLALVSVLALRLVISTRALALKGLGSIRSRPRHGDRANPRWGRFAPALIGALALVAAAPGSASAAGSLNTGIADELFHDPRSSVRSQWLDRAKDAHVSLVRLSVNWSSIAGSTQPADPTNPADPAYGWTTLDTAVRDAVARGLEVSFLLNKAPRWAEGPNRPRGEQAGSWKPNPVAFGKFAQALAERYSGNFPDPDGPGVLPRVRYYEAWNEPNLDFWLAPQYAGGKNTGPELYRAMHNSFAEGVKAVHGDNEVIGPALAPFGGITEQRKTRTRPLRFMRELFCLKGRRKLKPKPCPSGGRLQLDIFSHHPITVTGPPNQKAYHPDDATAGDMGKVKRTLRAAERGGTILPAGRRPLWVTEFWYRSKPPVPDGVPLKRHARWIQQSLYVFWKQGVKVAIYNLIRDRPSFDPETAFGLYFRDGDAKPAATAFAFPFVAQRKSNRKLLVWGKAPATGRLIIQRKKGQNWMTVKRLNATENKVFTKNLRLRGKEKLRAKVAGERSLVWSQKR